MAAENVYFNNSVNAAVLVETGMVKINHISVSHANSSPAWIQMFDADTTGDVTIGTTTPSASFPVTQAASGQHGTLLFVPRKAIRFPTGLVIAVTTAPAGSTGITKKASVSLGRE